MKCKLCNKTIYPKITWSNLFNVKKQILCDSCYSKYKIKINYQVVPINNQLVHIYSLFPFSTNKIRDEYYLHELSLLMKYIFDKYIITNNDLFIYYEYFKDIKISLIEGIKELIKGDIIIMTCFS